MPLDDILSSYRDQNAGAQDMSDAKLTLDLGRTRPDLLEDPSFKAEFERINNALTGGTQTRAPSALDYAKESVGSAIRGAADTVAGLPEAAAIAGTRLWNKLELPHVEIGGKSLVRITTDPTQAEDSAAMKLGRGVRAAGEKLAPDANPQLAGSFWASKLPSTLGSIGAFVAGGGIGKALTQGAIEATIEAAAKDAFTEAVSAGLDDAAAQSAADYASDQVTRHAAVKAAEMIPNGVLGAGTQAAGAYNEALANGASPDDAFKAYLLNLPIGAAMALPAHGILGEGKTLAGKVVRDTAIGTGVMAGQQIASNAAAKLTYDPDRDLTSGLKESAGAGAIVTAALSALSHKLFNQKAESGINPSSLYETDPDTKQRVADVIARVRNGETGPAIETALASIEADPHTKATYILEKNRNEADVADRATQGANEDLNPEEDLRQGPVNPEQSGNPDLRLTSASQARAATGEMGQDAGLEAVQPPTSQPQPDPSAPAHDWLQQNIQTLSEPLERSGVAEKIEALAAQRKTANEIARDLGLEREQVLAVRARRNIPSMDDPDEFNDWLTKRSKQPPAATATLSPEALQAARAAAVRYSDRGDATDAGSMAPIWGVTQRQFIARQGKDGLNPERAQAFHKKMVTAAVARGESVPQRVLSDYPGIINEARRLFRGNDAKPKSTVAKPRRPWQYTASEWLAADNGNSPEKALQAHRLWVQEAIDLGEAVPAKVIADYPDLAERDDAPEFGVLDPSKVDPLDRVAFDTAQVVARERGRGRKSAPAFIETQDPETLFTDVTADASDRTKSRKLAVMLSPDGTQVHVGTAYENSGNRYVYLGLADPTTHIRAGIRFDKLVDAGYKLIASIKTNEPTKRYGVTYSPREWSDKANEFRDQQQAARGTAAAMEEHIGRAAEFGDAAKEAARAEETTLPEHERLPNTEFTAEHSQGLADALSEFDPGKPEADLVVALADSKRGIAALQAGLRSIIAATGVSPETAYQTLKNVIYEKLKNSGSPASFAESIRSEIGEIGSGAARESRAQSEPVGERSAAALQAAGHGRPDTESGSPGTAAAGSRPGTKAGADLGREIERAASAVEVAPTKAQKEAGNYRKGHVNIEGLDVTIENAKGSVRSGADVNGRPWSVEMPAHYGYLKGTEGAEFGENGERDHLDVYIGKNPESDKVWVIDQRDPFTHVFNEHKALIGFQTREEAVGTYLNAFSDGSGRHRIGAVTEMTMPEFKDWLKHGDTTEALAYDPEGSAAVRNSQRSGPGETYRASKTDINSTWNNTLDAARANGIDVRVFRGLREGGRYSPRSIALTVADPLSPSHDNLVLALHEIGHDLFSHLSEAQRESVHRAIAKLATPEGFNIKIEPTITGAQRARVAAEEILVERAARTLAAEGFDPVQARTFGQQLLRALKQIYLRAAMVIQRGLLGADHVSGDLAQRYFEQRLRSFLAGDSAPRSFISFIGGPKLTRDEQGDTFKPTAGAGALAGAWNYATGSMDISEALPDSMEALAFNAEAAGDVRFSARGEEEPKPLAFVQVTDPHVISADYNSPPLVEVDVAAYNVLHEAHQAAFRVFQQLAPSSKGYSFEQFLQDFTNADGPAAKKIGERNRELVAAGHAQVDTMLRPADLESDARQMQAADKALRYLSDLKTHWSERRTQSEAFLKNAGELLNQNNQRLHDLTKQYENMEFQEYNARLELNRLHAEFGGDMRAVAGSARKIGMLSQVVREMDNHQPEARYVQVINQLYRELTGEQKHRFVDILQKVAGLDIDWKRVGVTDAVDLISKMIAPGDPQLHELKNRALAAITVAFAKANEHVMEFLHLSRSDALEERTRLNEILRDAMGGTDDALARARELVKKLPRLAVRADRLLTKLQEIRDTNHAHLDEMQRAKTFVAFHEKALPVISSGMVPLEKMIGARAPSWEATEGAEYFVAPRPGVAASQVMERKKVLTLGGVERDASLVQDIKANRAWLDSVPPEKRGADWETVRNQTYKLEQVVGLSQREFGIKQSVVNTMLGSVIDKLESADIPALRFAAQKTRIYNGHVYSTGTEADSKGVAVDGAAGKAMRALGMSRNTSDRFQRLFYQSARSYAEKRADIFLGQKDIGAKWTAFLPELRRHLESDPATRQMIGRPGAWYALEKYYRAVLAADTATNEVRKKFGSKILEVRPDGTAIEREPVGDTFASSLRHFNRGIIRLYQRMRDSGWLGTMDEKSPFDQNRVSGEHATDPEGLEQRLAKYFPPEVQRGFFRPLATEKEGRSAFYAPKREDGITLPALRENVRQAYQAAQGKPVKFAEALYDLESRLHGGTSESLPDFVGKTMDALHSYFRLLHGNFSDWDDAARKGQPSPKLMFADARASESCPGTWLEYRQSGRYPLHELFRHLAGQSAFGRNMGAVRNDFEAGLRELSEKADRFADVVRRVEGQNPAATGKKLDALVRKAIEEEGENYLSLSQARGNLDMVEGERRRFENLMASYGGLTMELRPFQELIGGLAGLTVNGPLTALVHLPNLVQAFSKLGLSRTALTASAQALKSTTAELLGSLFQLFHMKIGFNAEANARRVKNGIVDPDAFRRFDDAMFSYINGPSSATNPITSGMFKAARTMRVAESSGFGRPVEGATNVYPTFKPHAPFAQTAAAIDSGVIDGFSRVFSDLIERSVEYFRQNPGDRTDSKFRFERMTDLGYGKGFMGIGNEARAFNYLKTTLARYGIDLETQARDVLQRRERGEAAPALNDDQFRVLASMAQNEVTLESNIANRPSAFFTNPILRVASPLLGWIVSKTHNIWEDARHPSMAQTSTNPAKALAIGALPYLALVPAGIAIGILRDQMSQRVLGKKPSREDAATSFSGMVEALSWAGTFGLPGELVNAYVNRGSARPMDLDHRIFFLNSIHQAHKAIENWWDQGGTADWESVYRPLMMALGGNGALQTMQTVNNMLSLDNAEARTVARLNVSNYLRAAGREIGLPPRPPVGIETSPTLAKPFLGQMLLASFSNDVETFRTAYQAAVVAAKAEGKPDPQKYVREAFAEMNPLRTVFQSAPTEDQYRKMLGDLDESGREAVRVAINRFNGFASQIGAKPFAGKPASSPIQALTALTRTATPAGMNLQDIRRQAASYGYQNN